MKSLTELYRIGLGPSSSHTMGPRFAALAFRASLRDAARIRVTLYGSLAATGRGHLTDHAVSEPFAPTPVDLVWAPERQLPRHPNALRFEALAPSGALLAERVVYSVGGGALWDEDGTADGAADVYPYRTMDEILEHNERQGLLLWELVGEHEGAAIWPFLGEIWAAPAACCRRCSSSCSSSQRCPTRKSCARWRPPG